MIKKSVNFKTGIFFDWNESFFYGLRSSLESFRSFLMNFWKPKVFHSWEISVLFIFLSSKVNKFHRMLAHVGTRYSNESTLFFEALVESVSLMGQRVVMKRLAYLMLIYGLFNTIFFCVSVLLIKVVIFIWCDKWYHCPQSEKLQFCVRTHDYRWEKCGTNGEFNIFFVLQMTIKLIWRWNRYIFDTNLLE